MIFTDFLGNEIKVGDFVVYATVSGRSPVQKFAVVEKIEAIPTRKNVGTYREPVWEPATAYKVGVKELTNGRGFTRWDSYSYKDGVRVGKPVRTTYPNVLNIVKAALPPEEETE
jgi:hypothetical protein